MVATLTLPGLGTYLVLPLVKLGFVSAWSSPASISLQSSAVLSLTYGVEDQDYWSA